ncbi:MAG: hypothetical protein CSA07_00510 [Bacteroidia bacterium]|nr:MAG: hypothetical protein CSA07_00510 [Bacteroidia bacterium]
MALVATLALMLASCNKEKEVLPRIGLAKDYLVVRLEPLALECGLEGESYRWETVSYIPEDSVQPRELKATLSRKRRCVAIFDHVGLYNLNFYYNEGREDAIRLSFQVKVEQEPTPYSAYISEVLEYRPAPGYYVNPRIKGIPTHDEPLILRRCRSILVREDVESFDPGTLGNNRENFVSLGAFGGYVVFAFDHMVVNQKDPVREDAECNDFIIYGRNYPGKGNVPCYHPGIVYVAYDRNGNGKRDEDEKWYQLRGEVPHDQLTRTDVRYTYNGGSAVVSGSDDERRGFHLVDHILVEGASPNLASANSLSSYWPYVEKPAKGGVEPLSFSALRLPEQGSEELGATKADLKVTWKPLRGYADSQPYGQNKGLDISNAVDEDGRPVDLPGIHFVKVQTGVLQQLGGENGLCETKIMGAADLRLLPPEKRPK